MSLHCEQKVVIRLIFGCGSLFLVLAIALGLLWPMIATTFLHKELQLKQGSLNYKNWVESPIPMYLRIKLFNWTNPHELSVPNSKPHFDEIGPYVFLEKHTRVNISFNENEDTVAFQQFRTWHFVPKLSNGTLDDEITNVNVIAASAAFSVRHSNVLIKELANVLMQILGTRLTITKTVRELLFNGYNDTLLTFLKKHPVPGVILPPFDKFGWFVDRNLSATFDGNFEMYAGQKDILKMGSLTKWNHVTKTQYYHGECSDVNGTSGELWPMHMNATNDITFFVSDLCRPITLSHSAQPYDRYGITGSRWIGDYRVFDNGQKYPPNSCYCTGDRSSCPDLLTGVHNMSDCRFGAPVFASFPHFYLADASYADAVSGLKPNKSEHEFSLSLEPNTGIPLEVNAKIQINVLIQPQEFGIYKNVPKTMIPVFWFAETVELDEVLAKDVKMAVELPSIGGYIAFGIAGLGFILVFAGTVLTFVKRRDNYENLEEEEDDDELSDSTT